MAKPCGNSGFVEVDLRPSAVEERLRVVMTSDGVLSPNPLGIYTDPLSTCEANVASAVPNLLLVDCGFGVSCVVSTN
jgi:hypothetical protein